MGPGTQELSDDRTPEPCRPAQHQRSHPPSGPCRRRLRSRVDDPRALERRKASTNGVLRSYDRQVQQIDLVERFLVDRFPGAAVAVVAGSTARGNRTRTSDIDLLLIGDHMLAAHASSLAATFAFEGETFEVFAYSSDGFEQWARKCLGDYRPVILNMLLEGIPVRGAAEVAPLRAEWRTIYDEGPVVSPHEMELRRYAITDLIDDLRDATDPLEQRVVAFALFERIAELMLLSERRWIGAGKYLPRRLRGLSEARADTLARPLVDGDVLAFADRAEEELDRAGGRVQAGFVR
ncbi:MAG: hypothetical protein CMH38_10660 [Microbacterium sp.]|nr:hypothetical protein [Microbacterium sp.]HBR87812.1 hypothetical protein [Microbacterium sp.]HBS73387.1 hypothetical protein [Microbacterium sp.]